MVPVAQPHGERRDGERLHDVRPSVLRRNVLEDTLIDGPAHEELEARVVAVAHVGEVLVGEQFEQHGRHVGHPCFVVGAVPQPAAAPLGFARAADVADHLRHHQVGQIARAVAVGAPFEAAVLVAREEDSERANRLVAVAHPRVGVERQRQVERNAQSGRVTQPLGAPHEGIDPQCARHEVVLVVVAVALGRIDRLVEAGPLQPVARPLAEAGHAARLGAVETTRTGQRIGRRAGDVAVAAADFHGIGRDDASGAPRTVRKHDGLLLTRIEKEAPEVDPRPAPHRLVDGKAALAAQVADRIEGVVDAPRRRVVAHVEGILPAFGDVDPPHGAALGPGRDAPHVARRALQEGVLARQVDLLAVCKAHIASRPSGVAVLLAVALGGVVVGQHLVALPVPLAGQQDARPRIFEHGDQEGQHVALRIEVLARLPEAGPLPAPAPLALVEVAAVALPEGDVTSGEPRRGGSAVERRDERPRRRVDEGDHTVAPAPGLHGAAGQRDELLDEPPVGIEFDARLAEGCGEQRAHRVVDGLHVLLAEGIVR